VAVGGIGQTLKDQTTVQQMKVVLIAIITGIFQTNQMTLVKEFGDGVSDDIVMLFFLKHLYRCCCEKRGTLVVVCMCMCESWAGRIMLLGTYNGEPAGAPYGAQC